MLIQNQKIALDFESKIPIKITSFSYKEGEIDKNGIEVDCLGVNVESGATITAHWLYSTQEHYVYVENAGSRIDGKTVKVVPPQNVLYRGEIGLEVHLESAASGLLKSQTASIPVVAALVNDEEASAEDENLNVILNLINATSNLHDAAIALDAEMQAAEVIYSQNEAARTSTFKALETSIATNISSANTAITNANAATTAANTARDGANTAANNADSKATLANTAATNANTAATGTNTAKTALDGSISTANTTKTAVDASATNANTKATLANDKATLADQKATLANTAATNANTAATNATNAIAEVVNARVDYFGTTHADVDERIKADFNDLAKRIPSSLAMNGYESVTTNDTLSGDVSSMVMTGQTLVNLAKVPLKNVSRNLTVGVNSIIRITDTNKAMFVAGKTYTVMAKVTVTKKPEETSSTAYAYPELLFSKAGGYQYIKPIELTKLSIKDLSINTPVSGVSKFVLDSTYDGSVVYEDFMAANVTVAGLLEATCETIILEGDHTDKPLEFFEGLKSSELSEVTSHGVNLMDIKSVESYGKTTVIDDKIIINGSYHTQVPTLINAFKHIESGKKYILEQDIKCDNNTNGYAGTYLVTRKDRTTFIIQSFNNNKYFDGFNIDDIKQIDVYGQTAEPNTVLSDIRIYEVTPNTPTTYTPYTSSKTTLSEPIILRSLPNGVVDTYDVDTGVLTRRCGEVVLNGGEAWSSNATGTNTISFFMGNLSNMKENNQEGFCDEFLSEVWRSGHQDKEYQWFATSSFGISIAKPKLATPDVAGFKAWLAQNPVTVVYQLATPTTEYIENNGQLRSYDSQTTVFANSVVPVKLSGNIPVNYASTLSSALSQVSLLKAENQLLRSQMETQVAEVRDELNQVHAAMYRMMNFNQSEEGDHVTE